MGLAVAMGCREAGASRVIGVDINPEKFAFGNLYGSLFFFLSYDESLYFFCHFCVTNLMLKKNRINLIFFFFSKVCLGMNHKSVFRV